MKKTDYDRTKVKLVLISCVICIVIIIFLLVLRGCCQDKKSSTQYNSSDIVLNGSIPSLSREELLNQLQKKQDASMFTVQVVSGGTIETNGKTLKLTVANPGSNQYSCIVDILYKNEILYTSPILPPQSYIEQEKLNNPLPNGEHKLTVRYHVLDGDEEIGITDVEVLVNCN